MNYLNLNYNFRSAGLQGIYKFWDDGLRLGPLICLHNGAGGIPGYSAAYESSMSHFLFRHWCKYPAYLWSRFVLPYQGILLLCFILAFLVIFSTVLGALPSRVVNSVISYYMNHIHYKNITSNISSNLPFRTICPANEKIYAKISKGVSLVGVRRQIFEPTMGTQYFPKFLQSGVQVGSWWGPGGVQVGSWLGSEVGVGLGVWT